MVVTFSILYSPIGRKNATRVKRFFSILVTSSCTNNYPRWKIVSIVFTEEHCEIYGIYFLLFPFYRLVDRFFLSSLDVAKLIDDEYDGCLLSSSQLELRKCCEVIIDNSLTVVFTGEYIEVSCLQASGLIIKVPTGIFYTCRMLKSPDVHRIVHGVRLTNRV
jgi:hypothetical protein